MEPLATLTPENCEQEASAFAAANPAKTPPLHALIEEKRFEEALLLAERGLYVDRLNYYLRYTGKTGDVGQSALLTAVRHGAPSSLARGGSATSAQTLVAGLLDHGASLYGDFSASSLFGMWAPEDEDAALDLVRLLVLRCGVAGTFWYGQTLLHGAAEACFPRLVAFLLDAGIDPDVGDRDGTTPAQYAASNGFYCLDRVDPCLKALSAKKSTRDRAKDNLFGKLLQDKPIHTYGADTVTLTQQLLTVFHTILARGERPDLEDDQGRLPLDSFLKAMERSAATYDEKSYPTYLQTEDEQAFARDVALFLVDHGGASPSMLPLAAYAHLVLLLEALLSRLKPSPNAAYGRAKNTLLHEALRREEFSGEMTARTLRCLLAYGVDPGALNGKKKSALDVYATTKRTLRPAWRKTIEAALAEGAKSAGSPTALSTTTAKKQASKKESEGLRFTCAGLHLAVMGALRDKKLLKLSLKKALKGVDAEGDEDARIAEAVEALHALPLDPSAVAKLQSLGFDGGKSIYADLEEALDVSTGGETEAYGLQSLEGIAALTSLTTLSLDGHGYSHEAIDLSPLANHPALTSLTLSGTCSGTRALESIGTLERVKGLGDAEARERLKARGVDVA